MIFERLTKLIAEQFGMDAEDLTEDTGLEELGADSVDLVELSMNLEEEFGIDEMGEDDIAHIRNVGHLLQYLQSRLGEE